MCLVSFDPCEHQVQPSVFAVGGFGASSGSWAFGGGANLVLHRDRFRITVGAGGGSFHYSFFGIGNDAGSQGNSIQISQRSKAFLVEPKVRVFRRWYLGPRYHIITNDARLNRDSASGARRFSTFASSGDLSLRTAALGLRAQNDIRDKAFYPRAGSLWDGTIDFYDAAFGLRAQLPERTSRVQQVSRLGQSERRRDARLLRLGVCPFL